MKPFGLIGKTLSHSYSPFLHEKLGDVPYELFALEGEAFAQFMQTRPFSGVNVTIPYKQDVMTYCANLDETAREIGAVNTLINENGDLHGYNTDAAGLSLLIRSVLPILQGKNALVLGAGGTSCTAQYVLRKMGASRVFVASRSGGEGTISYKEAMELQQVHLLVNTTPVGMYPNNGQTPIALDSFGQLEAVVDVVYNPAKTALLLAAEKRGIPSVGGLAMLAEQARVSSALFLKKEQPLQRTAELCAAMRSKMLNLVLIGMPGCGKSSLGRKLAQSSGRNFVDLDTCLEEQENRKAGQIIETDGESVFRDIESGIVKKVGKECGQVISTGGGVVLRPENVDALRQNGILIWIDCPVNQLALGAHRPLSRNMADLEQLYTKRHPLYKQAADVHFMRPENFSESVSQLTTLAKQALEQPQTGSL